MSEDQGFRDGTRGEDYQTRIRVLEATVAVQRLGLEKASALIAEFEGGNLEAVATDVSNWIDYGLSPKGVESYENRVRGLVDLLLSIQAFLGWIVRESELFRMNLPEQAEGRAKSLDALIRETIQALPPVLRGGVCKLVLGCPDSHTRDCRKELEKRFTVAPQIQQIAEDFAGAITGSIGQAFTPDLAALVALAQRLRVQLVGQSGETVTVRVAENDIDLDRRTIPFLDRLWERYNRDGTPVQADVIETEEGGKPS